MSTVFDRMVNVSIKDGNDEPLVGSRVEWFLDGKLAGTNTETDGHASITLKDRAAAISIRVSYPGQPTQEVKLAATQDFWEFKFENIILHARWRTFMSKHWPAIVGILFILLAVVLVFVFNKPTALQTHVILGMVALGGG